MKKITSVCIVILCFCFVNGCHHSEQAREFQEKNRSTPLIDESNPIDERQEMIKLVEDQKEELKPGFVSEEQKLNYITMYRRVNTDNRSSTSYSARYGKERRPAMYYNDDHSLCEQGLDEHSLNRSSDQSERYFFQFDGKEGYYYHVEHQISELIVKFKDKCYIAHLFTENEGIEESYQILDRLSRTLKTEEEGVYEPLYDRFTIDLNRIRFPMLNQERATILGIYLSYRENEIDGKHSAIQVLYSIDDEIVEFEITDGMPVDDETKIGETLKTENGVTVRKYMFKNLDHLLKYRWSDGRYDYEIRVNERTTKIPEEGILSIVDSVLSDDRTFESLDFFQATNKDVNLSEEELELQRFLNLE